MTAAPGRIIRVRTFDWKDGSHIDTTWWAAIDDDAEAVRAVKLAIKARADDHQVEVFGVLQASDMTATGLKPGEVVAAQTTKPD